MYSNTYTLTYSQNRMNTLIVSLCEIKIFVQLISEFDTSSTSSEFHTINTWDADAIEELHRAPDPEGGEGVEGAAARLIAVDGKGTKRLAAPLIRLMTLQAHPALLE